MQHVFGFLTLIKALIKRGANCTLVRVYLKFVLMLCIFFVSYLLKMLFKWLCFIKLQNICLLLFGMTSLIILNLNYRFLFFQHPSPSNSG